MKLSAIQKEINKNQGDRALVKMSDDLVVDIPRIPTGVLAVDKILGGGFPRGKTIEVFGRESGGKTSLALRFTGQAQKFGSVVYIDLENALDPTIAANSGVNMNELFLSQPESAENALEIVEACIGAEDVSAIIVDSVAGMTPAAEIRGDMGDSHVGLAARLMSQALRKLTTKMRVEGSNVTVVWINQVREIINSMPGMPNTTTPGGRALKFYSSVRLEVARTGQIKQGDEVIGHTVKVKTVKNRYYPPYKTATFDIMYDSGISNASTVVDLAVEAGLIDKGKAGWFTVLSTGEKVQGRPALLKMLEDDPATMKALEKELL